MRGKTKNIENNSFLKNPKVGKNMVFKNNNNNNNKS
jgi:hypothetical protein